MTYYFKRRQYRKIDRMNKSIIILYGLAIFIVMFGVNGKEIGLLLLDLTFSMSILFLANRRIKQESVIHQAPIYYYVFLLLVTITVYLNGGFQSYLFPILFILPVMYVSINFPRKGSTGVAIFSIVIIWLLLLQDSVLTKINYAVVITVIILFLPQIVGLSIKRMKNSRKN